METQRLIMRQWRDDDLAPFAALNADPEVMRYFPDVIPEAESNAFVARERAVLEREGWGLWAVEVKGGDPFIGFVGLKPVKFEAAFAPAVEVGWRLARSAWGNGYATEAGKASVSYGFETVGLEEIVSFTAESNLPSRRVMERLGMTHDPAGDFDHPVLSPGDPLRRHVLYRLRR